MWQSRERCYRHRCRNREEVVAEELVVEEVD